MMMMNCYNWHRNLLRRKVFVHFGRAYTQVQTTPTGINLLVLHVAPALQTKGSGRRGLEIRTNKMMKWIECQEVLSESSAPQKLDGSLHGALSTEDEKLRSHWGRSSME